MTLFEYQAKRIFKDNDIPIPNGVVCSTEKEARVAFTTAKGKKGRGVVLKPQVLSGGRGKSEGIRSATSEAESADIFQGLKNTEIKGFPVEKVLIEEKLEIKNKYYVGVTIDPTFYKPVLLISSRGGVDVETIAKESPSALDRCLINRRYGIPSHDILNLIEKLGISNALSVPLINIVKKLYDVFCDYDATLTEINPLVELRDGRLVAVDGRLNVDNNALFRHPELEELKKDFVDNKEIYLKAKGVDFVYLGGNVGLICVGAGMSMATMDLVNASGGKPACFCDVSAGINPDSIEHAIRTVSGLNDVQSILINMFGGITRMDEVATSFLAAWKSMGGLSLPIVIRLEGTNVEEGRKIMEDNGFEMFTDLYDAVEKAVVLVR
jgi:succinyl-CoA synthetase beta subunit